MIRLQRVKVKINYFIIKSYFYFTVIVYFFKIFYSPTNKPFNFLQHLYFNGIFESNSALMFKLFNLTLLLNGFPMGKARKKLAVIVGVSEDKYTVFTDNAKNDIVQYHLANNPFYKDFIGNQPTNNWIDIPVMQKKDLQRPLAERLSKDFTLTNVYINKTSGSSGAPFVFAKDKEYHALIWANIMRKMQWHGINYNTSWQARFYGMPLDFMGKTKVRIKDFLSHRFRFNIFDSSDNALEKVVEKFKTKKFFYINGYTSSIVLFAKYLQKKDLILKEICPNLRVCVVTSEMLFADDKILLEKQFGVPVINEYGSAELDIIALEDANGNWQVNAETTFVEILDDNNRPMELGQEGKIVVTALYNKAHPMIRYDVGDRGALSESSTTKYPILKKLTGRTNDIAILPSGKIASGMTFYSITKKLFDDEGNVKEFVIVQLKPDTFEIIYTSDNPLTTIETENIKSAFSAFLEPGLTLILNRKKTLERTAAGKLKQFTSEVIS